MRFQGRLLPIILAFALIAVCVVGAVQLATRPEDSATKKSESASTSEETTAKPAPSEQSTSSDATSPVAVTQDSTPPTSTADSGLPSTGPVDSLLAPVAIASIALVGYRFAQSRRTLRGQQLHVR